MTRTRIAAAIAACTVFIAASCASNNARTQTSSGQLDVNAFTATRTVLVRVQNNYPTRVHVFTIIGNRTSEIANLTTDGAQTVVLDPSLFPGTSFSLDIRPETGPSKRLGPFHLSKGVTANLTITPNLDSTHVDVHPTVP